MDWPSIGRLLSGVRVVRRSKGHGLRRGMSFEKMFDLMCDGKIEAVRQDPKTGLYDETTGAENMARWYRRDPAEFVLAHAAAAIGYRMLARHIKGSK